MTRFIELIYDGEPYLVNVHDIVMVSPVDNGKGAMLSIRDDDELHTDIPYKRVCVLLAHAGVLGINANDK